MSAQDGQPVSPVANFAVQAVRETLGRATDVDACVALTGRLNDLLRQAAQHLQQDGTSLACKAGCNFCCHLRVMVLPHEAIALFRHLQSGMPEPIAQRVRARLRERAAVSGAPVAQEAQGAPPAPAAAGSPRRACAFLDDGQCAAYEVRPSACAAYHSLSKERCQQSFQDPSLPTGTVALQSLRLVAMALEAGLVAGLQAQGLSHEPMELHAAVAALLGNPALIARWRAGRSLIRPGTGITGEFDGHG